MENMFNSPAISPITLPGAWELGTHGAGPLIARHLTFKVLHSNKIQPCLLYNLVH